MCGIVGVVATGPVNQLLYDSLQLLQHRGRVLLSAGESIAVQNFNENLSVLVMLACYSALLAADWSVDALIYTLGLVLALSIALVMRSHHRFTKLLMRIISLFAPLCHVCMTIILMPFLHRITIAISTAMKCCIMWMVIL